MAKIMITNNGPHSAETWAMTTAEVIVDIDPGVIGDRLFAAQKLRVAIAEALVPHHASVQEHERNQLAADESYIQSPYKVECFDQIMNDIVAATADTLWAHHFTNPSVQRSIAAVVADHFVTAQHIERLWHADRHPDCAISHAQFKE